MASYRVTTDQGTFVVTTDEGPLAGGGGEAPGPHPATPSDVVRPFNAMPGIDPMSYAPRHEHDALLGLLAMGVGAMGPELNLNLSKIGTVAKNIPEGGLPELGTVGQAAKHLPGIGKFVRLYDFVRGLQPEAEQPAAPEPFRPNPAIAKKTEFGGPTESTSQVGTIIPRKGWAGPPEPIPEITPQAPTPFKPNPNIARNIRYGGPVKFSSQAGTIIPRRGMGGAAPIQDIASTSAGGIPPVTVPSETLPSQDWRFEDARDMARLLNQHGINPADMGEGEWNIAAPALKRNLGVPNDRAAQLVQQEWNKLQAAPRGQ